MIKDIQAATTSTDQEEVAKKVAQYNYLSLPVVNRQNKTVIKKKPAESRPLFCV